MRKSMTALAAVIVFTACDGNPFEADDTTGDTTATDTGTETSAIPDTLANNLSAIDYDPVAKTLTVEISALDTTPFTATYSRNLVVEASTPGYEAYSVQEDALDRLFVALVAESGDGSVQAAVAADGGQFNRFFSGAYYERTGSFDPPDIGTGPGAGQVSYAGQYAGLDNYSGPQPVLPPGADPTLQMAGPGLVTGDVFINANFADMKINGSVFNRVRVSDAFALDSLILVPTDIAADGTFFGSEIEKPGVVGTDIGDYGGIIGGVDGMSLAGTLVIDSFDDTLENESERGIFVLTQCGMPGEDATLCAGTAP